MPKIRPKYINREKNRHGQYVWYFRRPGCERIRLPNEYDTTEFWDAYNQALAGKKLPTPVEQIDTRSLRWLVDRYRESADFTTLARSTQRVRENILLAVIKNAGTSAFTSITPKTIQRGMDARAAQPESANGFLKAMRALMKWAVKAHYMETNPADGIERIANKSDGFHVWTVDEVLVFQTKYPTGTRARLAMDLMLYTGLRRSDIVRVGKQHIKDGILSIKTQKTGAWVSIPVLAPLLKSIEATKTGDLHFIVTDFNKPFTAAGFGNWFGDRCREAGVPGRAHGLRKAAATMAADNGATSHELMAIFGWAKSSQADIYTKEADRKKLSMAAAHKMLRHKGAGGE